MDPTRLPRPCPACGSELAPGLLVCPACGQLIFSNQLKALAAEAEGHERAQRISDALRVWREALTLLPPNSRQYQTIQEKVNGLASQITAEFSQPYPARPAPDAEAARKKRWSREMGGIGILAALFWKFKFAVLFILTKAKFVLLGLTKASTFFSMALSFAFYWRLWGWKFAAGLIGSIYLHEMGHVFWLQRYGIKATAPMFIPGFGAMIRLRQYPSSPAEEARVGLAGPLWGLGAAALAGAFFLATRSGFWVGLAKLGGWINLFNLMPIWQLDGAHAFKALTRAQRMTVMIAFGAMFLWLREPLLILLTIVAAFRLFDRQMPSQPDRGVEGLFLVLIVALSFLAALS